MIVDKKSRPAKSRSAYPGEHLADLEAAVRTVGWFVPQYESDAAQHSVPVVTTFSTEQFIPLSSKNLILKINRVVCRWKFFATVTAVFGPYSHYPAAAIAFL